MATTESRINAVKRDMDLYPKGHYQSSEVTFIMALYNQWVTELKTITDEIKEAQLDIFEFSDDKKRVEEQAIKLGKWMDKLAAYEVPCSWCNHTFPKCESNFPRDTDICVRNCVGRYVSRDLCANCTAKFRDLENERTATHAN